MTWGNVLKMAWLQNIDFESHDAPRIGRYIKYLENLLDENHRYGFKRWWSMGRIKTVAREEGAIFDLSKDPTIDIHEWKHGKPGEGGDSDFTEYTRDLPSSGLEHMKAYFERNKDIDSDMDIAYEKEYENDPDSALEKADKEFEELIEDLDELIGDLRKRWISQKLDASSRAMYGQFIQWANNFFPMKPGEKDEKGSYFTISDSHHGLIINIYPHWLPWEGRMEGGRRSKVTHLQIRSNTSQGPGEWNLCYMSSKKRLGELCIYKGKYSDLPPADHFGQIMDIAFSADTAEQFGSYRIFGQAAFPQFGWGNLRDSQKYQVGNIKEWHYLPEDSAWYTKGMNIIKATLDDLMKIGREWDREIEEIESISPADDLTGEPLGYNKRTFRMKPKPKQKKWWEKVKRD